MTGNVHLVIPISAQAHTHMHTQILSFTLVYWYADVSSSARPRARLRFHIKIISQVTYGSIWVLPQKSL